MKDEEDKTRAEVEVAELEHDVGTIVDHKAQYLKRNVVATGSYNAPPVAKRRTVTVRETQRDSFQDCGR